MDVSSLEEDTRDCSRMVLAAKNGEWSEVFSILDRKPRIINSIPEERAWGALHQAAWYKDEERVQKMLSYRTCDSEIKTKQDRKNEAGPGRTPLWIAQNLKPNERVASILYQFAKEKRAERFGGTIPSYVTAKAGKKMDREGLPLLLLTLANYKQTFHPGRVTPQIAFNDLLKEVFKHVDAESSHQKYAMNKTSSSIYAFDKAAADFLSTDVKFPGTTDEQRFFARTVKLYTKDHIYREVNTSLRREGQKGEYKPTADDLALGPYTLLLDALLFYWGELKPVSNTTYRGMTLKPADLEQYAKGTQFVWLNFVSTSLDESVAEGFAGNTLFEISNNTPGPAAAWRPRDLTNSLHDLHEYPHEKEALYPAGAEFKVTDKYLDASGKYRIKLQLMNPLAA